MRSSKRDPRIINYSWGLKEAMQKAQLRSRVGWGSKKWETLHPAPGWDKLSWSILGDMRWLPRGFAPGGTSGSRPFTTAVWWQSHSAGSQEWLAPLHSWANEGQRDEVTYPRSHCCEVPTLEMNERDLLLWKGISMFFSICYVPGTVLEAGVQQQMKQSLLMGVVFYLWDDMQQASSKGMYEIILRTSSMKKTSGWTNRMRDSMVCRDSLPFQIEWPGKAFLRKWH